MYMKNVYIWLIHVDCEDIPYVQGQRSPSKMVGGAKSHLESNLITARDAQGAETYLWAPGPRHPTERQNCV